MDYSEAIIKLQTIGQEHLLQSWNVLNKQDQECLLDQIAQLDIPTFRLQQQIVMEPIRNAPVNLDPFSDYAIAGSNADRIAGRRLIAEGHVGCLLIAGGQGTRLRIDGPKGIVPVTMIKHKSLFQLFSEKVLAAGKQANRMLPLAIMTSPLNHVATVQFFHKHNYFGLQPQQVTFFSQGMLPFLDPQGDLILENHCRIAQGPDGNGSSLAHFVTAGVWDNWHTQGVKYVNYVLIDNALADPFDAELMGYHYRQACDITVKCTQRRDAVEKVGVLVKQEGKLRVVEYSELPEQERNLLSPNASLKHSCANLSLFCLNMDFITSCSLVSMPLHTAYKTLSGKENRMVWKFEKFIFDILQFANKASALSYQRDACFAPLKNASGPDSIAEVQHALQIQARNTFATITGINPPDIPFELSQEFYYPTPQLLSRWQGAPFPHNSYIQA